MADGSVCQEPPWEPRSRGLHTGHLRGGDSQDPPRGAGAKREPRRVEAAARPAHGRRALKVDELHMET